MEKTVNDSQVEVYNNYRELFLVIVSFVAMVLYLRGVQQEPSLSHWLSTSLLAAAAIFNCALFLMPKPKASKNVPIWPYIKSYAFACLLWTGCVICVAWRDIASTSWECVGLVLACLIFALAMLLIGIFFMWSIYFSRLITLKLSDEKMWKDIAEKLNRQNVLAECAINYRRPRYVYEDGFESETPQDERGMVVGYRISPTLVIHCVISEDGFTREDLPEFQQQFGGRLLEADDIKVLRQNWKTVSDMRIKNGDAPLPTTLFWYNNGSSTAAISLQENFEGKTPEYCGIIMKL
ncbi:MAG: hypothetical protein J6Y91_05170 [Alphaproteobacteria bacterium]|nr:hypothetical protein [Alphaproteobacteria bacterium]